MAAKDSMDFPSNVVEADFEFEEDPSNYETPEKTPIKIKKNANISKMTTFA